MINRILSHLSGSVPYGSMPWSLYRVLFQMHYAHRQKSNALQEQAWNQKHFATLNTFLDTLETEKNSHFQRLSKKWKHLGKNGIV